MQIIEQRLTMTELRRMAAGMFGNMVKAVVDVEGELLAIDGELHSDLEAMLIENGSSQKSLWGINLYPDAEGEHFVEFDSMINMRPSQGNTSRGVESAETREKLLRIVAKWIQR